MKINILGIIMGILLFSSIVTAQDSYYYCVNTTHSQENVTLIVSGNTTTISELVKCHYGCDNSTGGTNQCKPDPTQPTLYIIAIPLILFILSFMFLYIANNMKEYKELQFLFLGITLFFCIVNGWFASNISSNMFSSSVASVMSSVYYATIIVMIAVVFYFIIMIIWSASKTARSKRGG